MFSHMRGGSVAHPFSIAEMTHFWLPTAKLQMKPAGLFLREGLQMDCMFGLLLKIRSSEAFPPLSEGCRGWSLR